MTNKLTHTDNDGKANMVDVGQKPVQHRIATAEGKIFVQPGTIKLIRENKMKKGDVLTVAKIAGIQGAKKTADLVPLCHPLILNHIEVELGIESNHVYAKATVKCNEKTGVEMEALTAVQVALLTVYDMCKAVDKSMVIGDVKLVSKLKSDID